MGWYFLRHGGRHDVWSDGTREIPIPRHVEINEYTVQNIIRQAKGDRSCD
ncbi:MAG: type II toxin-antitoxin system HicA family toxin [Desulfobacterota bacterium]|nr:type II toxin-antitoxin system HicA family toxin [Thermodesulfobacteriota bacterium]